MEILGLMGVILVVVIVVVSVRQREKEKAKLRAPLPGDTRSVDGREQRFVYAPEVQEQLQVVAARARKRRSDYGTKRAPKVAVMVEDHPNAIIEQPDALPSPNGAPGGVGDA